LSTLDWIVLFGTLVFIVAYGTWKTRGSKTIDSYIRGGNEAKWWTVGLSVMATQASAITFLSTPGQAYADGMRFVQFYFGLPIAMVILCVTFIPIFYKLKVYTAYEFLEKRFDVKTRSLTALLFLVQRGLAAGITIYAPAIILSTMLGWRLDVTNLIIGSMVILYTVSGGTKAVNVTHKFQMLVIMSGMFVAFYLLIDALPQGVSFSDALHVAGASGRLNALDFTFDLNNRYTIWTGILGGLFLHLSYFGTDQSQVQRYLSGKSVKESRLGLVFNGLLKVPMQFFILMVGVMVFVFYQFYQSPVFFNRVGLQEIQNSEYANQFADVQSRYDSASLVKRSIVEGYLRALDKENEDGMSEYREEMAKKEKQLETLREEARQLIAIAQPEAETNDRDYVFITFILDSLPTGLIGLLLAVIFSAAMSSTSAELNALASTTVVDIYQRHLKKDASELHFVSASRVFTLIWGGFAILFATYGSLFENLIQFVNIIGSIFYGTILGIFLVAFYLKKIGGTAVFWAAVLSETIVIFTFLTTDIGFLWYNVIGCCGVIFFSFIIHLLDGRFFPRSV
jgi:SSS family solute:Na+ symporter